MASKKQRDAARRRAKGAKRDAQGRFLPKKGKARKPAKPARNPARKPARNPARNPTGPGSAKRAAAARRRAAAAPRNARGQFVSRSKSSSSKSSKKSSAPYRPRDPKTGRFASRNPDRPWGAFGVSLVGGGVGLLSIAALDQQVIERMAIQGKVPEWMGRGTAGRAAVLGGASLVQGLAAFALLGKHPVGAGAAMGLAAGGIAYSMGAWVGAKLAPKAVQAELGHMPAGYPPRQLAAMRYADQLAVMQRHAHHELGAVYDQAQLPPPVDGFRPHMGRMRGGAYHPTDAYRPPDPYDFGSVYYHDSGPGAAY